MDCLKLEQRLRRALKAHKNENLRLALVKVVKFNLAQLKEKKYKPRVKPATYLPERKQPFSKRLHELGTTPAFCNG